MIWGFGLMHLHSCVGCLLSRGHVVWQNELILRRMPLVRLLDKKFMYDMFHKAVQLAKKDHAAEEVETLQRGLGAWRLLPVYT